MDTPALWLREPAHALAPAAVLAQPVGVLQGVTPDAEAALQGVGITTVLDLAASALFALARRIAEAAAGEGPIGAAGPLPADMIDDGARGLSAAEVARRPIEVLRLLEPAGAARLAAALPAQSVRDLGLWPPALAAHRLLNIAYGGPDPAADPEAPAELQPRMGRLPVDRLQYEVLLFEATCRDLATSDGGTGEPRRDGPRHVVTGAGGMEASADTPGPGLVGGREFPLDLTDALLGTGFTEPGLGFAVTLAQSWYSVGLSLGQLLHSLALAPGEATRIAIVDWSRRVASRTAEEIGETERLRAETGRNRAINEIARAVSQEAQSGFSRTEMSGDSGGFGLGGLGAGDGWIVAGGMGYAGVSARGTAASSSQGRRDVGGEMAQAAHDRTEQVASLARARRASIVSEVSVTESERLSTRIVANYNHMHALSVLYFEVVQIYRVVTECVAAEPVLFLPVRPLDFGRKELLERHRGVLARAALSPEARDALLGIEPPAPPTPQPGHLVDLSFGNPSLAPTLVDDRGARIDGASLRAAFGDGAETGPNRLRFDTRRARLAEVQVGTVDGTQAPIARTVTVQAEGQSVSIDVAQWARPPKDPTRYLPEPGDSETAFHAVLPEGWEGSAAEASLAARGGGAWQRAVAKAGALGIWPRMRLVFALLDPATGKPTGRTASLLAAAPTPDEQGDFRIARLSRGAATAGPPAAPPKPPFDLAGHLQANALHYTMALLRLGDPSLLGLILSTLKLGGRSPLGMIDPMPIAAVGNFLVFRWPALRDDPLWRSLCKRRGLLAEDGTRRLGAPRESLVPVASGGVFAEAVLGRFNAAEKLDLTRFWNWQDSPIPLVPPEIAPVQAGGRQGEAALRPGALGEAVLRVRDAASLPDPTGALAKAVEISGKGDAFRDMSGLAGLTGAVGSAMQLSAQNAAKFMETAMQTVSAYGARVNQGEKMDQKAAAKGGAPAGSGSGSGGPGSGGTGSGGSGSGDTGGGGAGSGGSGSGGTGGGGAGATTGGSTTPAAGARGGVGEHERAAFLGPQPAPEAAPPTERRFSLLVRLIDRETRTDGRTPRRLDLDGALTLAGLRHTRVAGLEALVEISNGVGEGTVLSPSPSARVALRGSLLVSRWDVAELEVNGFVDHLGVPLDTVPAALLQELSRLNALPLAGDLVALPADGGTLTLDLSAGRYPAQHIRRDLREADDYLATLEPVSLAYRPLIAGASATDREVAMIAETAARMVRDRARAIRAVLRDRGTSWFPLLGGDLAFDPRNAVATFTPRWCALSGVQIDAAL